MIATPRTLRQTQINRDLIDAAILEGAETRLQRQSVFGVKEQQRAGYTKNHNQKVPKTKRKIAKESRRRNRQ